MERRALIAVVISLAILVLYQEVVLRYIYPPPSGEEEVREAVAPMEPTPGAPSENPPEFVAQAAAPVGKGAAEARHLTVDTDLYRAVFTSKGARLESFQLKNYRTTVDPDSPFQETVVPGPGGELPFGVELRGATQVRSDTEATYTVSGSDITLKPDETGTLNLLGRQTTRPPSASDLLFKATTMSSPRWSMRAMSRTNTTS